MRLGPELATNVNPRLAICDSSLQVSVRFGSKISFQVLLDMFCITQDFRTQTKYILIYLNDLWNF